MLLASKIVILKIRFYIIFLTQAV